MADGLGGRVPKIDSCGLVFMLLAGENEIDGAEEIDTIGWPGTVGKDTLGNTPCPGTIVSSVTTSVEPDGEIDTSALADWVSTEPTLEIGLRSVLTDCAGDGLGDPGIPENVSESDGFTVESVDSLGLTSGEAIPTGDGPNVSLFATEGIAFVALGCTGDTDDLMSLEPDGPAGEGERRIVCCPDIFGVNEGETAGSRGVGVGKSTTASMDLAGEGAEVPELNGLSAGPCVESGSGEFPAPTLARADSDGPGSIELNSGTGLRISLGIGSETDTLGNSTAFDESGKTGADGFGVTVTEAVGFFEIKLPSADVEIEASALVDTKATPDSESLGSADGTTEGGARNPPDEIGEPEAADALGTIEGADDIVDKIVGATEGSDGGNSVVAKEGPEDENIGVVEIAAETDTLVEIDEPDDNDAVAVVDNAGSIEGPDDTLVLSEGKTVALGDDLTERVGSSDRESDTTGDNLGSVDDPTDALAENGGFCVGTNETLAIED